VSHWFPEESRQGLLNLENHQLSAADDPNALESVLAPDFLQVVPAGIIAKNEQLDFMRNHPSRGQGSELFEDMHVRSYGNAAIVNGMLASLTALSSDRPE